MFPYEYFDCYSSLAEYRGIPPIEAFHSKLSDSGISEEDHAHAWTVYHSFQMKNFGQYLRLYNELDTVLLCDVFEAHRELLFSTLGNDRND